MASPAVAAGQPRTSPCLTHLSWPCASRTLSCPHPTPPHHPRRFHSDHGSAHLHAAARAVSGGWATRRAPGAASCWPAGAWCAGRASAAATQPTAGCHPSTCPPVHPPTHPSEPRHAGAMVYASDRVGETDFSLLRRLVLPDGSGGWVGGWGGLVKLGGGRDVRARWPAWPRSLLHGPASQPAHALPPAGPNARLQCCAAASRGAPRATACLPTSRATGARCSRWGGAEGCAPAWAQSSSLPS